MRIYFFVSIANSYFEVERFFPQKVEGLFFVGAWLTMVPATHTTQKMEHGKKWEQHLNQGNFNNILNSI